MGAEKILMECADAIGDKIYGLASGGKDSASACYIAHQYRKLDGIVTIDTTCAFYKIVNGKKIYPAHESAKALAKLLKVPFILLRPKKTFREYCLKYGMPHTSQHSDVYHELKWKPMKDFVRSMKDNKGKYLNVAYISGVRKKESKKREKNAKPIQVDQNQKRMRFVSPIIYWDNKKTWEFATKNKLPLSSTYTAIHLSGDCGCGANAGMGEAELIATFYPEFAREIAEIERSANKKHNGKSHWGNHSSMKGAINQSSLHSYACADCTI